MNEPSLDERSQADRTWRRRLLRIPDLIDPAVVERFTAHEAEERAIEQMRKLGQEGLSD